MTLLTMRPDFVMQDRCGFRAGDTNLRRYVHNNPTNAVDPSGLAPAPKQVPTPVSPDLVVSDYAALLVTHLRLKQYMSLSIATDPESRFELTRVRRAIRRENEQGILYSIVAICVHLDKEMSPHFHIERLVSQLDSRSYRVRKAAEAQLLRESPERVKPIVEKEAAAATMRKSSSVLEITRFIERLDNEIQVDLQLLGLLRHLQGPEEEEVTTDPTYRPILQITERYLASIVKKREGEVKMTASNLLKDVRNDLAKFKNP
jgi:hypothetical protein